jgi:hypothetical protein
VVNGVIRVWGDRGLAIIYGATLGGWAFLITRSFLIGLDVSQPVSIILNVVISVVVTLAFMWQVQAWDKDTEKLEVLPPKMQKLMEEGSKNEPN